MIPPLAPTDQQIRTLAAEILRRDEYAMWRTAPWLTGLLEWLTTLRTARPSLYFALVGVLALVTVVLLVHVTWAIRTALATPSVAAPLRTDGAPDFLEEAEALAHAGRFLDATRRLQLAVLDLLLRARVLELHRSDPNRTLRQRLRAARIPEPACGELLGLIDRLERRWFRDRSEDRELYESWRGLLDRLPAVLEVA